MMSWLAFCISLPCYQEESPCVAATRTRAATVKYHPRLQISLQCQGREFEYRVCGNSYNAGSLFAFIKSA